VILFYVWYITWIDTIYVFGKLSKKCGDDPIIDQYVDMCVLWQIMKIMVLVMVYDYVLYKAVCSVI